MNINISNETVEVPITLRGVEACHNGAFFKRWKYWEYVPNIAVGYMLKKYLLQYKIYNYTRYGLGKLLEILQTRETERSTRRHKDKEQTRRNWRDFLAKAYEVASEAALQKAVGESEEDAETKTATK